MIKISSIIILLSHGVMCLSKKIKTKNNKGSKLIKKLFDMDGLPSLDDSIITYQRYLQTHANETFQIESFNKLSLNLKNYLVLFIILPEN